MFDESGGYSQEYLEYLYNLCYDPACPWEFKSKELQYKLASIFTEDVANEDNFFLNSIGFWKILKDRPNRDPDYTSLARLTKKYTGLNVKSSEYWYRPDGVIRGSDHWGGRIASCSWYLYGVQYYDQNTQDVIYAYIPWKDLKAKGNIYKRDGRFYKDDPYGISGFEFKN